MSDTAEQYSHTLRIKVLMQQNCWKYFLQPAHLFQAVNSFMQDCHRDSQQTNARVYAAMVIVAAILLAYSRLLQNTLY